MSAQPVPASTPVVVRYGEPGPRTLVCLSFCGGGPGAFRPWAAAMPAGLGLAAVCYPGREGRFLEPYAENWDELVDDVTRALMSVTDQPYVLLGHSMGGWVAFNVVAGLERQGVRLPDQLIISSCNPPDRGCTERDRFPAAEDTDDQLLDWLGRHGVVPEYVLGHPDLKAMALNLMRADIRLRDSFYYRPARMSVPLHVVSGRDDQVVAVDATTRWRALTTGLFTEQTLPGGHFYTPDVWRALPVHLVPAFQPR